MALPSGFSTTLSNPIGILLVLLGLAVMPVAVLVLPFDFDRHCLQIAGLLFMVCEEVIWLCGSLPLKNGMRQVGSWK